MVLIAWLAMDAIAASVWFLLLKGYLPVSLEWFLGGTAIFFVFTICTPFVGGGILLVGWLIKKVSATRIPSHPDR